MDVRLKALRGGLNAPDVARVRVYERPGRLAAQFVVKRVGAPPTGANRPPIACSTGPAPRSLQPCWESSTPAAAKRGGTSPSYRRMLRPLERLVSGLPALRRELLAAPGAPALLHGDAPEPMSPSICACRIRTSVLAAI